MFPILLLAGVALVWASMSRDGARLPQESFKPGDFTVSPDGTTAKLTDSGLALLKQKLVARVAAPILAEGRLMGLDVSVPAPAGATAPAIYALQQALLSQPGSFAVMTAIAQEGTQNENLFIGFYMPGTQPKGTTYVGTAAELSAKSFFA